MILARHYVLGEISVGVNHPHLSVYHYFSVAPTLALHILNLKVDLHLQVNETSKLTTGVQNIKSEEMPYPDPFSYS